MRLTAVHHRVEQRCPGEELAVESNEVAVALAKHLMDSGLRDLVLAVLHHRLDSALLLVIRAEKKDEMVRHGAGCGDAEPLARDDSCGAHDATDIRSTRHSEPRLGSMYAPQREVPDRAALRRIDNARGLGRDARLVIDDGEHGALHERGFDARRDDAKKWRVSTGDRPFGNGVDAPAEAQRREKADELAVVRAGGREIVERRAVEVQ